MPELPEVEVVRRGLETHAVGRRIDAVTVLHPRPVRAHPVGPDAFATDLTGLAVEALPEDLDQIDHAGALRQAAEALLAEAGDAGRSQAERDTAASALARLYALTQEVRA